MEKFKPNVWQRHDWGVFSSLWKYTAVFFYCFFVLSVDCNNFFLKYIMWVPPEHKILQVRLAIWAFSAIAATKEFYEFVANPYCKRVGPFIWLTSFTLMIEFSIVVKFGSTMFTAPFPWYVQAMWSVLGVFIVIGGIIAYSNGNKNGTKFKSEEFNLIDPKVDVEPFENKKNK